MENGWVFEDAGLRKKWKLLYVVDGKRKAKKGDGNLSSAPYKRSSDLNQFPHHKSLATAKHA
jgi:hypothetical protein